MTHSPLVTIGILCYNQEDFIEQAIQSAINQDYRPLQIIISDDNSSDKTQEIVAHYQKRYSDIIEFQQHNPNIGICKNLMSFFPLIKGDFFCWLGGDDYFLPKKISTQVKMMQETPSLILCYHDVNVITEEGAFLYRYNDPVLGQKAFEGNIANQLIERRCFISALSMMVSMKKIGNLSPTDVSIYSDWLFFIEVSMKGAIAYCSEPFGVYRRHCANVTKKIDVSFDKKIYNYLIANYPAYKKFSYKGMAWSYTNYVIKYLLMGKITMAASVFKNLIWLCLKRPSALIFVISQLRERIISRTSLFIKTGSLLR